MTKESLTKVPRPQNNNANSNHNKIKATVMLFTTFSLTSLRSNSRLLKNSQPIKKEKRNGDFND